MTDPELYPKPLFSLTETKGERVPIILHLPHSGTFIPEAIAQKLQPEKRKELDETDWFLDQLYDFCSEMGILMVKANYHRWVADLNRDPANAPLYDDGRVITSVIPEIDFNGDALYSSPLQRAEIDQRINLYHHAYFEELQSIIDDYHKRFGKLLIWDGHSIRRIVPGIQKDPFPDLILGTNNRTTCPLAIHESIKNLMDASPYSSNYDSPFKGGYITRSLASQDKKQYTIQMEMSKDLYMDSSERQYDEQKAENIKALFVDIFTILINQLCQD